MGRQKGLAGGLSQLRRINIQITLKDKERIGFKVFKDHDINKFWVFSLIFNLLFSKILSLSKVDTTGAGSPITCTKLSLGKPAFLVG